MASTRVEIAFHAFKALPCRLCETITLFDEGKCLEVDLLELPCVHSPVFFFFISGIENTHLSRTSRKSEVYLF